MGNICLFSVLECIFGMTSVDGKINFEVMPEAALQVLCGVTALQDVTDAALHGSEARFKHGGLELTARVLEKQTHCLQIKLADEEYKE